MPQKAGKCVAMLLQKRGVRQMHVKCTKLIFDYGCCEGFGLGSKRVEIYSIALRNSNPNKRISPMLSCRNTRATIGGVSLGTMPEEAGEGAGMVK